MQAINTAEVRKYKAVGAAYRAVILLGVVAGLAAIGAQAPQRDYVTLNCAYDPSVTGTMTDAVPEIPGLCASPAPARDRATTARHAVPEASSIVGTASGDEVQPPTF